MVLGLSPCLREGPTTTLRSEPHELGVVYNVHVALPEFADALAETALLKALNAEERARLSEWFELVMVPAAQTVVGQSERNRDLYVCLAGQAIVIRGGVEVEQIGHGAWFGEIGLVLGAPRAASVVATTSLRLARLTHVAYRTLAETEPALGLKLLETLLDSVAARLGNMSESVTQLLRAQALPQRTQVQVRVAGAAPRSVRVGTSISELLCEQVDGHLVVAALVDRKPVSLRLPVTSSCELEPLTTAHWEGLRVYRQSLSLLLLDAASQVLSDQAGTYPDAHRLTIMLGHPLGFARRVLVRGAGTQSLDDLAHRLEAQMQALVARELPLLEELWSVEEAQSYFEKAGAQHTQALFRCWRAAAVAVCSYGGRYIVRTGPLVANTSVLGGARVVVDEHGLLLLYGDRTTPAPTPSTLTGLSPPRDSEASGARHARRVSSQVSALTAASEPWQSVLGIDSLGAYNRACIEGSVPRLIRVNEGFHEKALGHIADQIVERSPKTRIVCISGPSSSGKTTFIERLKVQLHVNGKNPIGISLDNYYRGRRTMPLDDAGEQDYEALHALDLSLLNTQLEGLLCHEHVRLARYDFVTGTSQPAAGPEMALCPDDLLIIEGIHALNPAILGEMGRDSAFLIFVCPLGQLPIDEVSRVHASDARLLRRIVRDRHTRATGAEENILRWPSVRRGERAYIFPFQHRADAFFDSGLAYELSVLKVFAERYLLEVQQTSRAYPTAFRLLALLDRFVTIYPDHVPQTSLLREFIGQSGYAY